MMMMMMMMLYYRQTLLLYKVSCFIILFICHRRPVPDDDGLVEMELSSSSSSTAASDVNICDSRRKERTAALLSKTQVLISRAILIYSTLQCVQYNFLLILPYWHSCAGVKSSAPNNKATYYFQLLILKRYAHLII